MKTRENKYGNNSIYHWKSTVYGNKNTISHNGSTIVPTFVLHLIINELVTLHRKLSVGIISIYGVGSHASYPNAHKLLLHTDTVLKAYTLIERLERDVLDERYSVYLYVVDFCTELNGLCFLTSYDGTYIMTVNAHNTVIDLPAFKHFLFLYKTFPTMESRF